MNLPSIPTRWGVKPICVSCPSVLILEPAHVLEVIRELEVPVYETTEPGHFLLAKDIIKTK